MTPKNFFTKAQAAQSGVTELDWSFRARGGLTSLWRPSALNHDCKVIWKRGCCHPLKRWQFLCQWWRRHLLESGAVIERQEASYFLLRRYPRWTRILFDPATDKITDPAYAGRVEKFLNELVWMSRALRHARENIPAA